ncbi:MAG TPA: TolC family protein [Candidatus Acidoferrales bacterium]|jgi:outer membrane protein|nr:TolC family protein [Candidatus Acidoferrales bacterium]
MLRITTENKRGKLFLSVEGSLSGPRVATLEQCWRELSATSPRPKFFINLCGVSFIDNAGKVLLKEMYRQGAELLAEGCLNQAIVTEIIGPGRKNETREPKDSDPSKGSPFIFYVIFFSLILIPSFTWAQTKSSALPANAPTDTFKLTLEQAVALAIKQNPTQQIAVLNAAESIQDKNISRSDLLPQANFSVADSANRENVKAQFGGKLPPGFPFPGHIGPYQIFSAGPTFGTNIFDLTLWKRYQETRSNVDVSKANSLSTREQVILLVVSQYIGTLRAVANVEASRSRVELAQALYDQAADLQKEGVGTGIDTLRANVELQNEKQRLIEAENDREASLYGLSKLLNLDPRQKIELADSLGFFDTPQPEVEASIDDALSTRQEWKAIQAQQNSAKLEKQASQSQRLPSLRFDGNWAYYGSTSNSGIPTYQYQASVNMPLFTGGRIRAEVVKADLELQKIDQQKADLRNQIALDVKTSLLNLQSARSEVQVANLGVQLAKEEVDQARDRFKAGVANNIEVISAQDSLSRANDNQIAALYRFNQARADFARAVGQMEKTYAK